MNLLAIEKGNGINGFPKIGSILSDNIMRTDLIEQASKIIPDPQILVNVVSQCVEQLNNGRSPLVPTTPHMGLANIALTEIIEGKIVYEKPQE